MGLGAPKRRSKLSHDPNNTAWSRSTNTYGHKILSAQGWKPGDYLGAENANHSDHYTAANASHIRILLREENLGIGAQIRKGNANTFGLSLFSGVLGRLNGKSDAEVQTQQGALRDAELRSYQAQKYGLVNFVSGGFLVGDEIRPAAKHVTVQGSKRPIALVTDESEHKAKRRKTEPGSLQLDDRQKKKKRKESKLPIEQHQSGTLETEDAVIAKTSKRKATRRDLTIPLEAHGGDAVTPSRGSGHPQDKVEWDNTSKVRYEARDASRRKQRSKKGLNEETLKPLDGMIKPTAEDERSRAKEQKRARKEERRKRKEEKRRAKDEIQSLDSRSAKQVQSMSPQVSKSAESEIAAANANRNGVRQRYIQQKRMAFMDPQAMKEIFMLTAAA